MLFSFRVCFSLYFEESFSVADAIALVVAHAFYQQKWDTAGRLQQEREHKESIVRQKANAVFPRLDLDGNGWIDAMELKRFFRKIAGESQLERRRTAAELLRFFDRNGDGVIDCLEFELGCLAVQHSEGDEFIQNKLQMLFAVVDTPTGS